MIIRKHRILEAGHKHSGLLHNGKLNLCSLNIPSLRIPQNKFKGQDLVLVQHNLHSLCPRVNLSLITPHTFDLTSLQLTTRQITSTRLPTTNISSSIIRVNRALLSRSVNPLLVQDRYRELHLLRFMVETCHLRR
jgi:hypothetical protein